MFNKNSIIYIVLFLVICSGCVSDEIIDSKPGEALAPVENLDYNIEGAAVEITWELPRSLSADIIKPVSVQIRVAADGQNSGTFVIDNAPESFLYSGYDSQKTYRVTVKVMGAVDTAEPHVSNLRYSLGKTVSF
jgi:hypothetical protein